jgi:putative inorganic carbon (HCO3(-)) transporter
LFLGIGIAAWLTARRAIILSKARPDLEWVGHLGRAFQVSLIGYAVGGTFVNIGYWDLMYYEIVIITAACRLAAEQTTKPLPAPARAWNPVPAGVGASQQRPR